MQLYQDALERRDGQLAFSRRPGEEEKRQVPVGGAYILRKGLTNVARRMPHIAGHEGDRCAAFCEGLGTRDGHSFITDVVGMLANIANDEYARCCRRMIILCHGYASFALVEPVWVLPPARWPWEREDRE